jgi:hypothetical protein
MLFISCSPKGIGQFGSSTKTDASLASQQTDVFELGSPQNNKILHVIFSIDTSGSMKDNTKALVGSIESFVKEMTSDSTFAFTPQKIKFHLVNAADNPFAHINTTPNTSNYCRTNDSNKNVEIINSVGSPLAPPFLGSELNAGGANNSNILQGILNNNVKNFLCGLYENTAGAVYRYLESRIEEFKGNELLVVHFTDEIIKSTSDKSHYKNSTGVFFGQEYNNYINTQKAYKAGGMELEEVFGNFPTAQSFLDALKQRIGYKGYHVGIVVTKNDFKNFYKDLTNLTGMGKEDQDSFSVYEMPVNSSSSTVDVDSIIEEFLINIAGNLRTNLQTTSFTLTKEPIDGTIKVFTKINNTESLIKNWKYFNGSVILLNKIAPNKKDQLIVKYSVKIKE